jgi:uncharacterized protein involved in cysteine biosynthesis
LHAMNYFDYAHDFIYPRQMITIWFLILYFIEIFAQMKSRLSNIICSNFIVLLCKRKNDQLVAYCITGIHIRKHFDYFGSLIQLYRTYSQRKAWYKYLKEAYENLDIRIKES